jgi:transketolase
MTGSLGHGLGIACGMAKAAKLDKKDYMVFTVLGDAECQEGSVWEAVLFANQHKLSNLVTFVDRNRLGCEDFTENTSGLDPMEEKWKAFGWDTRSVDGHSFEELFSALQDCRDRKSEKPLAIIANTVKGKGVSCLENNPKSHHTLPQGEQINIARKELQ